MIRVCKLCDAEFSAERRSAKYCSAAHRKAAQRANLGKVSVTVGTDRGGHNSRRVSPGQDYQDVTLTSRDRPPKTDAERLAEVNRLYGRRAGELTAWVASGQPVREFPDYPDLTGREVSAAIGWVPWPGAWGDIPDAV